MNSIDLDASGPREAVRHLLNTIKKGKNLRWEKFANQIGFDKEDVIAIVYGRKKPWHEFVVKLVKCCEVRNYAIPPELAAQLGVETKTPAPRKQPQSASQHSFISALGIDTTIREASIQNYQGSYLHFAR